MKETSKFKKIIYMIFYNSKSKNKNCVSTFHVSFLHYPVFFQNTSYAFLIPYPSPLIDSMLKGSEGHVCLIHHPFL